MAGLGERLRRLELVNGSERCPACGLGTSTGAYEVEWNHESAEPAEPEWCPECGRQTVYVVRWDDVDPRTARN